MSKEVIYLEPEDDITDILTKLQRAEQKLVALVPPKKATILRSAVNMKLVARAAKECKKIVVIVTADPAILKMAMAAQIPVAKTLQSRPVVPTKESLASAADNEQVIEEGMDDLGKGSASPKNASKTAPEASNRPSERTLDKSADVMDISEESLENGSKDGKKASNSQKKSSDDKKVPSFDKYRKWIIIGAVAAVFLIVFGVWALVFAPSVKITVAMNTTASNFSEDISFTTDKAAENVENGVFYAAKQTIERKYDGEFTPTGREDKGEKASGKVTVTAQFVPNEYEQTGSYSFTIDKGDVFTTNSLEYIATSSESYNWSAEDTKIVCGGQERPVSQSVLGKKCSFSLVVSVEAARSGMQYNLTAGQTWENFGGGTVSNGSPLSGGTTEEVVVVSQVNVDKVKDELVANHSTEGKEMLFSDVKEDEELIAIEASYDTETVEVKSDPAVGSEVDDGKTPKATVTQKYSVYTIDKSQVEEYIKSKMHLADDQKIYSIGEPYIERFTKIEEGARLKTVVKTGPTVTEEDILEKVKGKKTGEVQSLLRSINGVSSVEIVSSFFWVWSVPEDTSKITIDLTMEDK